MCIGLADTFFNAVSYLTSRHVLIREAFPRNGSEVAQQAASSQLNRPMKTKPRSSRTEAEPCRDTDSLGFTSYIDQQCQETVLHGSECMSTNKTTSAAAHSPDPALWSAPRKRSLAAPNGDTFAAP
ncbi:hypothetical protein CCM_06243 [Cordyceps militaris CM01]|uniref:Uncharacterized protein n=1 Tax=Cordyceps militaris (strain CM01) TaxID=983644 RepID=G3JJJ5_CORMM|nr:uncharacterized protein CCM_06243 [Cordyceps militaris CM01]EGX92083.1 hypothetical protein CCM_06243 [Cordyceps militaris CM01]